MSCWRSDYTWREYDHSDLKKITLSVVFDRGTQCQFSRVRITLLCSDDITSENYKAMQITPQPSSFSVVDRSTKSQDIVVTQNNASLPICDIVFMVDLQLEKLGSTEKICGKLVLSEPGFPISPHKTIFGFDHILTNNTQSVSTSFTSSHQLYSVILPDGLSRHLREKVGRVVRILPVVPRSHQSISLPVELLRATFEHLYCHQPRLPDWRKDMLSCALVCRQWTCALDLLVIDFRHEHTGRPLEITSFARALVQRPNLGLEIRQLSTGYFRRHPNWESGVYSNRRGFLDAFATLLRLSRNIQVLSLDVECNELEEVLCGLDKLQVFECPVRYALSLDELLSCITTWPSLEHLRLVDAFSDRSPSDCTIPSVPLPCHLTRIELESVHIRNNELKYLVSTSGSTLQWLEISDLSDVTNAGLAAVLEIVCASLTKLCILRMPIERALGEEYALDTTIARMEHLTELIIHDNLASVRMLERRTRAFEARNLTEVHLRLKEFRDEDESDSDMPLIPRDRSLLDAAKRPWAGWKALDRDYFV